MPGERRYPCCPHGTLKAAAMLVLAAGALVLFASVPCWAWWALLGLVLIVLGFLLLRGSWR